MSGRIDQPRSVQDESVSHQVGEEGVGEGLVPEIHRNGGWYDEGQQRHHEEVVILLEFENWIRVQIGNVDAFPFSFDLGMFTAQQPAHVTEEEAPFGVVRVGVGFAVFVVDSVVARPIHGCILFF